MTTITPMQARFGPGPWDYTNTHILWTSLPTIVFVTFFTLGLAIALAIGFRVSRKANTGNPNAWQLASIGGDQTSVATWVSPGQITTSFNDIAGLDPIRDELADLVDFLKNPAKYERLGARVPRGVLLYGPPGTGKTMLAKALAHEAGVPFAATNGSAFINKYVGSSADRVRQLFHEARQKAPAIVFIDELDSLAHNRDDSHQEYRAALNQLLADLDGFAADTAPPVIIIGATNRLEDLDPAAIRPGRFDRHVLVPLPDRPAREAIAHVHLRNKPVASTVTPARIAQRTIGMAGADIANLCNEAAILAAKADHPVIDWPDIEQAWHRIIAGPALARQITPDELAVIAHHELGHAVATHVLGAEAVQTISVIPRGKALGYVHKAPERDPLILSQAAVEARIIAALAGRAAELEFFGEASTGAASDFQAATQWVWRMVSEYGMTPWGVGVFNPHHAPAEAQAIVRDTLTRLMDQARAIVRQYGDFIRDTAPRLIHDEVWERTQFVTAWETFYSHRDQAVGS